MLMHGLVLAGAERHPDRFAFRWVDHDAALTYAQAAAAMERAAGALAALGVQRGDRVTIFAPNGLDYLTTMLGAWRIGAIAALVHVRLADQLADYLADHTPRVVVYAHEQGEAVRRAGGTAQLVCMDGPQPGAHSLPELMAAAPPAPADPRDENAIAHLSYTSGSTGRPKGACLAHEPTIRAARCIGERLRLRGDDASFGPTALSSSYQLVANLLPQLAVGATINIMRRWTPAAGFAAIEASGATMLVANPPILAQLLAEARAQGRPPGRLRLALSGGDPAPAALKQAFRDELKLPLVESYGQSELGGFVALGYPEGEADDSRLARIGPPPPDKDVVVLDLEGRPLPMGATGELCLRGGFMAGYWNRPEATAEATRGGMLHTGDVGFLDADGCVTLRGRRAELIEVGGVTWFPREVEEALQRIPSVRLAAVIAMPDAVLGARPAAFVTLEAGHHLDGARLKDDIAGKTPYDLAPLTVTVLDEMPLTATGKIARAELAAAHRADS
ncbi:MAG: acyl--CoA ligase [Pseudomonadota bacterium]|nr:acyl--CoA ligase [Pseudomonadota bacterium]